MYNNYYIRINIKIVCWNMLVVGLLSNEEEANEIKDIAKVCALESRIRFIVRTQKIKEMLKKEDKLF